jgi:hypothetical protein
MPQEGEDASYPSRWPVRLVSMPLGSARGSNAVWPLNQLRLRAVFACVQALFVLDVGDRQQHDQAARMAKAILTHLYQHLPAMPPAWPLAST